MTLLVWLAALPCLYWPEGADTAPALKAAGIERLCVPPERAEQWRKAGLSPVAVSEADLAVRDALLPPGIKARADRASATRSPWVDANGWRFLRQPEGQYVYEGLPAGRAALAAAEAYAYGGDAVLKIDPADVESLGKMMAFLAQLPASELPDVADLAVVDDGSGPLGEVLNLLVRRNLFFRAVRAPDPNFRVNVKLGTKEYPMKEAGEPSALALKIRRQLTDEARTLRIFGSEVVIARVTGDDTRLRVHLLNYGGRDIEGLRIRLRGERPEGEVYAAGAGRGPLQDRAVVDGGTEFTLPRLGPYGVVDLPPVK
jgi:hypothetical protein